MVGSGTEGKFPSPRETFISLPGLTIEWMARTRISPAPGAFACSSRSAACLGPSKQRARAFKPLDMTVTCPLYSALTGRAFSIVLPADVLRDLLRRHIGCKIGALRPEGWKAT